MILSALNDALDYVYTYTDRSWTVVTDTVESTTDTNEFTMSYEIYKPYGFYLDKRLYKRTNLNIFWINNDFEDSFYNIGKIVKFWRAWKSATGIYHRWAPKYDKIDTKATIDIPVAMKQCLSLAMFRVLFPWWLEQWAQLAMTYYEMMKESLDRKKKIYWFNLNADNIKLADVYNPNNF